MKNNIKYFIILFIIAFVPFICASEITYISPLNGSVYVNEMPYFNATIDIPYIQIGMNLNNLGEVRLNDMEIFQLEEGINEWYVFFLTEDDLIEGDVQYFYFYPEEKAHLFNNIKTWILNFIDNLFFKKGKNLNVETMNITNVSYIKLNEVAGNCDLTVNHSICSNATGTYIVG